MLALFSWLSGPALWMAVAGAALLVAGVISFKGESNKIAWLACVCYGVPLGMFATEHFTNAEQMLALVPRYMPSRMFWVHLVGIAFLLAALSLVTRLGARWSGLLVGVAMFAFVAMLYLPSALRTGNRLPWTVSFRELSFGGGAWVLAGSRGGGERLVTIGRSLIGATAIFFAVQHFLHPLGMPGVPLQKQMPTWVPARTWIDYFTGLLLLAAGVSFLSGRMAGTASKYVGAWLLLLIAIIYVPVMVGSLGNASMAVRVEGISYFADTLLFAGTLLSVAAAGKQ